MKNDIKVAEMFAGVGGFNLALKRASPAYKIVWADQWEPERKAQYAFDVYINQFGNYSNYINDDISKVDMDNIPDIDMIVGGFPCQDYSVAHSGAKGIEGKKGVLWWDVLRMTNSKKPKYLFLENVDRLLTSPGVRSKNTGRDFAMILRTLFEAGYGVQWRVINAADYGFPQRRRRTFIFAFKDTTNHYRNIKNLTDKYESLIDYNPFSVHLPVANCMKEKIEKNIELGNLVEFSDSFFLKGGFKNSGTMIDGVAYSAKTFPEYSGYKQTLGDILNEDVDDSLFLSEEQIKRMEYLKGKKDVMKTRRHYPRVQYRYAEGKIDFPDSLTKPSRTMVTSEHSISRMTHIILDPWKKAYRFLSPEEAEKLNTFPSGWTESIPNSARYFTMGNALVVDLVKEIAKGIIEM